MLTKCANPACDEPFRYLRDGRIFRVERVADNDARPGHNVEHFWLCGKCSRVMMLRIDGQGEISVAPPRPGWERRQVA